MKFKDLSILWSNGENYSILSLPFVCYSIRPDKIHYLGKYEVSFKASFPIYECLGSRFSSKEEAKKACENHLKKLLVYAFSKLEDVVVLEARESQLHG